MNSESAQRDLSMIRQLMLDSQRAICDDGKHYLAWGVLMTAGLLLTYGALEGAIPVRVPWVWIVAIALGGVMATVLGAACFASAFLYRSRWVGALAVGWWLGGAAMFVWPGRHTLLVMAGMLIALQIVPGMLLYSRARAALEQPA